MRSLTERKRGQRFELFDVMAAGCRPTYSNSTVRKVDGVWTLAAKRQGPVT
jgi:hypothetical protein